MSRGRRLESIRKLAAALAVSAALAAPAAAAVLQGGQDTPPPPPAENFAPVTEAEVLAKLPEKERALVTARTDPRERFDALLDVSDLRLADVASQIDAHAASVSPSLLLYDSVVRLADQLIRDPASRMPARDKRFKQFEKRLGKQLSRLKQLVADLPYRDTNTGAATVQTVERVRAAALNSALGVDILAPPPE